MRSTITIVPSTMIPKSRAPMLSRLSGTPQAYMQMKREQQRQRDHERGQQRRAQR